MKLYIIERYCRDIKVTDFIGIFDSEDKARAALELIGCEHDEAYDIYSYVGKGAMTYTCWIDWCNLNEAKLI